MKKIAIIGHFGGAETITDGQTIKTKNLENLLSRCSDFSITKVDTHYSKSNKVKLLIHTVRALLSCECIFLLVSVNGLKVYLPLLHHLNRFTKKHIYHYVIGSELLEMVENDPRLVKYLNSLDANWFEYPSGTARLHEYGVHNAVTVPNFKDILPISIANEYSLDSGLYRFCTFSRVMREKGITDAIEAVVRINAENGKKVAVLDVYGPIDSSYHEEFESLLQLYSDCVNYKGCVNSQASADILKDYYALLFPTRWAGEGFPGTIIDAFAAGLPIIASDWNANKEIIAHMKHGVIYPSVELNTLYDAVRWSIRHPKEFSCMREECRNQFTVYAPETILNFILGAVGLDGDHE